MICFSYFSLTQCIGDSTIGDVKKFIMIYDIHTMQQPLSEPEALAKEANLRYVNPDTKGFSRTKNGSRFIYHDIQGAKLIEPSIVNRIESLKIPPAWEQVWISPLKNSHIQAVGIDEKGRKQYIYHPDWIALSQEKKFNKMLFFSGVLPEIRKKTSSDMALSGLSQEKVLATIVWLLEHTYIRIGNEEYAKENQHYGLTTLRNKHVDIEGSQVTFRFVGKSGKEHEVSVSHPRVARTIRKLEALPGYELFQYINDEGKRHQVTSEEVNDYLQGLTGEAISAKDFRTWGGTVLSATTLYRIGDAPTQKDAEKNITQSVKLVSKQLGNTPMVCRTYYIHPAIPKTYQEKILVSHFDTIDKRLANKPDKLSKLEFAVRTLLEEQSP